MIVVALIKDDRGNILLQRRRDPDIPTADGKWELTGGRVDFGEMPEDAVVREVREEIGCEAEVVGFVPQLQSRVWPRADGGANHVFVFCYELCIISGTPQPLDAKVSDVRWFSPEEIAGLDLLLGVKDFMV